MCGWESFDVLSGEATNLGIAAEDAGEQDKTQAVAPDIANKPFHAHWKEEAGEVAEIWQLTNSMENV